MRYLLLSKVEKAFMKLVPLLSYIVWLTKRQTHQTTDQCFCCWAGAVSDLINSTTQASLGCRLSLSDATLWQEMKSYQTCCIIITQNYFNCDMTIQLNSTELHQLWLDNPVLCAISALEHNLIPIDGVSITNSVSFLINDFYKIHL